MADYKKRLASLYDKMQKLSLDAFLVTKASSVTYLSGFAGKDSFLLLTPGARYFITDSRYAEEARNTLEGFKLEVVASTTYETIDTIVKRERLKKIGFESLDMPYEVAIRMKKLLHPSELIGARGLVDALRAVKDASEIAAVKRSVAITRNVMVRMVEMMKPGTSERRLSDAAELEFIKKGARAAFDPIIASDHNSSKPHARSTERRLEKNSFVMVDLGCRLDGYNSDMTRMVFLGKLKSSLKKIYAVVSDAQKAAFDRIRPGARISDVDAIARSHIRKKGLGRYFGHALGHGIGLEVHEEPTISRSNQDLLKAGMIFTVEPAVYIPGLGGMRMEDMVLVTKSGREILTR
jgi:Xaa-Pro aminopeptidase